MAAVLFACVSLASTAAAAPEARVALEAESVLTSPSQEWSAVGPAPRTAELRLSAMLEISDSQRAFLEQAFWAVSTPGHADYGNHLTQAQVTAIVAQPATILARVTGWLTNGKASKVTVGAHNDTIDFTITVADAEDLFATTISSYVHRSGRGVGLARASTPYSVPAGLDRRVRMIAGLQTLPSLDFGATKVDGTPEDAAPDAAPDAAAAIDWPEDCGGCKDKVTPGVLSARYSLPAQPTAATKSTLAVSEFQGQVWDSTDLDKFATKCKLQFKVTVDHENGTISPGTKCKIPIFGTESCGESLLDIEYAKGIGGGAIALTDVYSNGYNLLDWANKLAAVNDAALPMVMSVSYGNDEAQQTSRAFMESANLAFMKLGVRGVSILFASGDQGACGRSGCGKKGFNPDFPGASPYITTVGGTDFAARSVIGDEKAWTTGGGGFSNTFPAPAYQAAAVASYKTAAGASLPPASRWNATGRGYPDIAALAGQQNPYCIAAGEFMIGIAGTSAACPVVAAIFARLNAVRLSTGGKQMGFLNPWIYQNGATAFNDVSLGANDGGRKGYGFPATKGWDAATGWGTPNYAEMIKAL